MSNLVWVIDEHLMNLRERRKIIKIKIQKNISTKKKIEHQADAKAFAGTGSERTGNDAGVYI